MEKERDRQTDRDRDRDREREGMNISCNDVHYCPVTKPTIIP